MKKLFKGLLTTVLALLFTVIGVQFFNAQKVSARTSHNPVVLVHGLGGHASNFDRIQDYLKNNGWDSDDLYAVELPDKMLDFKNNDVNSKALSEFVNNVLQKTGSKKVDIVAHSMGGANSLYYTTKLGGNSRVDKLVTLGGANRLSAKRAPEGVKMTSIYSRNDFVVANFLSKIDGANNISISGVNHVGLLKSDKVNQLILQALN